MGIPHKLMNGLYRQMCRCDKKRLNLGPDLGNPLGGWLVSDPAGALIRVFESGVICCSTCGEEYTRVSSNPPE